MVTRVLFTAFVVLVGAQRCIELGYSARNERRIRASGGIEHAREQMPWMKVLHGAWLVSSVIEVVVADRPFIPALAIPAAFVFATGQWLRWTAIQTLGWRWNVRILTLPHVPPVRTGIYRHLSHPNYLGVSLEIAALPLLHSAWITSVVFTILNTAFLRWRMRAEEAALRGEIDARSLIGAS